MSARVGALWRTLVADTYNGQHPASSECGRQFTAHVSGLILRTLIQKRQEKRGFSKLLNVQSWKGRICQGFQKAFKGMSDADLILGLGHGLDSLPRSQTVPNIVSSAS